MSRLLRNVRADRQTTSRRAAVATLLSAAPFAAAAATRAIAGGKDRSGDVAAPFGRSPRACDGVRPASFAPPDQPFSILSYGYALAYPNISSQVAGTSCSTANDSFAAACMRNSFELTHGGGTPARVICNTSIETSTINGPTGSGAIDGPATNHWGLGVVHNVAACAASSSRGTAGSQHGGFYSHIVRYPPPGGYSTARPGAQIWGGWIVVGDTTNQTSSISGAMTGIEMDLSAGNRDDGGGRYGISVNLSATGTSSMCEWGRFLYVNAYNQPGNQSWFKSILELFAPYTVAGIDMSQGTQDTGNPITGASNSAVAIKLRAGQKYGLNGNGASGQYLTYNAGKSQTELWSFGRVIAAFSDQGGLVAPYLPRSSAGLPPGALYRNGNAVMCA